LLKNVFKKALSFENKHLEQWGVGGSTPLVVNLTLHLTNTAKLVLHLSYLVYV